MVTRAGALAPIGDVATSTGRFHARLGYLANVPPMFSANGKFHGRVGVFIRPGDAAIVVVYRYLMRAEDANCPGTIRYWQVVTTPDFTASRYIGTFCGASVNFINIHIAEYWFVPAP